LTFQIRHWTSAHIALKLQDCAKVPNFRPNEDATLSRENRVGESKVFTIPLISSGVTSVVGVVKWFDKSVGYGFATDSNETEEFLLHRNILQDFGINMLLPGTAIEFEFIQTSKGFRVTKILSLSRTPEDNSINFDPNGGEKSSKSEPVKVRWYNAERGYGFVNRFDCKEDIFIGAQMLAEYGRSRLETDEALSVRITGSGKNASVYGLTDW
jgi:CspA family cold shock protein